MGGSVDKVADFSARLDPTGTVGSLHEKVGVGEQKKKKKRATAKATPLTPQQAQARKSKAAQGDTPLLQQTALSPSKPSNTGAGTALL